MTKFKSDTIISEFRKKFGHLKKNGLRDVSIVNEWDYDVINVSTPLIFDHRKLPKTFMGLTIKGHRHSLPKEFSNIDNDKEYIWAYQRFEDYVNNHVELIRKTLNQPEMTVDEMLDALCSGDFKKHKENCIKWENEGSIPKWKPNQH